jgi:tetratricopeptide (TPR) repeat protein
VLNDPDLKAHAPAVVDDAAATYYAWGQARGSTDEALDAYNKLRQRFPKSVWATRATEQVASIYVGRADALRKKGQYAKAIQSYERVIDDYPHAGAVDRARTGVVEAETAWRRNLAGRLVDAIAEADRGADRLDGCYRQLDAGQKVKCLDVYLIGFGDTGLSIPDRFPALQAAYRQYRSALGILDEVKKILIDRCKSSWKYVTQQEVDTGRTRIKNTRGKLGQAKTAAEAAKAR